MDENRRRTAEAGFSDAVEQYAVADVRDLSAWDDGSFDLALAFGGPLSYAFDDAPQALRELLRVVAPGGVVLASVMSTLGTYRHLLTAVVEEIFEHGDDVNDALLRTGDLRPIQATGHVCLMFRAEQLPDLATRAGGVLAAVSASNWASLGDPDVIARLEAEPARWARFLDNEQWACRQPGALDGGTHLLFAVRRMPLP